MVSATLMVAARCLPRRRSIHAGGWADEERYRGENCGQAKRGKRWTGEIEEV